MKEHAQIEHIVHSQDASHIRLTVDTPEDFELIKILIEEHRADTLNYQEIMELMQNHRELLKMNAHIEQKKT